MVKFSNNIPTISLFDGFSLRELYVSDSAALFPTFNDEENHRFTSFKPHISVEQTTQWIEWAIKNPAIWAIASPDNIAIGFVGYHSIAYSIGA